MAESSTTKAPRVSREMRGRIIFVVVTLLVGAGVGYAVSRTGGSSGTTLNVSAALSSNQDPTTTAPSGAASVGYDGAAICAPTTDAATSGGSPQVLMKSAHEVASGTVENMAWSLWSANGQSGAAGLQNGGLVLDGHEYGLCPGYPNPSETEMIDTGSDAVIYGVVNYPGLATVDIGTGSQGFTMQTRLPPRMWR